MAKFERNFTKRNFYFVTQFMSKRNFYFETEGVVLKQARITTRAQIWSVYEIWGLGIANKTVESEDKAIQVPTMALLVSTAKLGAMANLPRWTMHAYTFKMKVAIPKESHCNWKRCGEGTKWRTNDGWMDGWGWQKDWIGDGWQLREVERANGHGRHDGGAISNL